MFLGLHACPDEFECVPAKPSAQGLGFMVLDLGYQPAWPSAYGLRSGVWDLGFGVQGLGSRV